MIKVGNKEVEGRYITDGNGVPHEVVAVYVGNNLVYNAKIEEENAKFYKRKTGGTQSVGSGIAAIKEVRGNSIVWNQKTSLLNTTTKNCYDVDIVWDATNQKIILNGTATGSGYHDGDFNYGYFTYYLIKGHKYYVRCVHNNLSISIETNVSIARFPKIGARTSGIIVEYTNTSMEIRMLIAVVNGATYNNDEVRLVFIDLTLMFGAGNEPATVAEFEKMFPLEYYDYNKGEVIPFAGQNLVTTGKNQYNHGTGKANLLGGQQYQISGTYTGAEIDGVAVTLDSNNCFTTTKDCVLDVTGGNDTDTIVALYNGENNTFEPYEKHTLPLDPSQWRDKQGNLVFPYGGMHGVGGVYDYAKVYADGYIRKAVRAFERRAYESGDTELTNVITDARTYTFYPIAEPVEVELATPVYAKYLVDKDGIEEITPANGSTPYTTMANFHLAYPKK